MNIRTTEYTRQGMHGRARPFADIGAPLTGSGPLVILNEMPFTPRSRRSRWLRFAVAVLALVASSVSVARAALGATCARTGTASGVVAAQHGAVLRGGAPETPHDAPAPPALASQCAPGAMLLPPLVRVAVAGTAWDESPLPAGPESRPVSHAPPPPFHPPRSI